MGNQSRPTYFPISARFLCDDDGYFIDIAELGA
jgi:hypothetical protein